MAEFLATKSISARIDDLISKAKKELVLISPYLQISPFYIERLRLASLRGVRIKVVYRVNKLMPSEKEAFTQIPKVELFACNHLHAKCYYNEQHLIISSMNMYEHSANNNWEMGVLLCQQQDRKVYDEAVAEAGRILQSASREKVSGTGHELNKRASFRDRSSLSIKGHCIRCEKHIPFNPGRPLCGECYTSWAEYENSAYEENVCHSCGEPDIVAMEKPECNSCYVRKKGRA